MELKILTKDTKVLFRLIPYLCQAYYENKKAITIKELSEMSGINIHGNFLSMLVHSRIIHNVKSGSKSKMGYIFSRDPKDIMVLELVQAMQGIPYSICSSEWYEVTGEVCPACEALNKGIDRAIEALRNLSLYEYALTVKPMLFEDVE